MRCARARDGEGRPRSASATRGDLLIYLGAPPRRAIPAGTREGARAGIKFPMDAANEEDQAALLERGDSETVLQEEELGRPHTSMSVSLVSIDEDRSTFSLKGRASFVWRISGLPDSAKLQQLLYPALSPDAQARCCELITQMLELLRDVITEQNSGYSADRFHPKKPIPKMRVPSESSFFYDYRVSV